MPPDGGLRDRLIHESLLQNLRTELTALGWFGTGEFSPITMIDEFPDDNAAVAVNTLAFSMGDSGGRDRELGNNDESHEIVFFSDFFAEDDSVGRHVNGDVYAFFRRVSVQAVLDYSTGGNPQFGTVEILDDIDKRKPDRATQEWQKHWYTVSFTIIDERDYA